MSMGYIGSSRNATERNFTDASASALPGRVRNSVAGMPAMQIAIRPGGNMGNCMMQLMMAHKLRSLIPGARITGYRINELNLIGDDTIDSTRNIEIGGHFTDVSRLVYCARAGLIDTITIRGIFCRVEYFLELDEVRSIFGITRVEPRFRVDQIVCNVRGGQVLEGGHPDYLPVPLAFYEKIIGETGLNPVFLGQLSDDYYCRALRARWPNAEFIASGGPLEDFRQLLGATHLAVAVSTFSWLAAWLGFAENIHMPLLGFLNPLQRRQIDLIPVPDARFRFWKFPVTIFHGTEDERERILSGNWPIERASSDDLRLAKMVYAQQPSVTT